ncbi:hypothetical protein AB0M96_38240, partial [Streptomyces sp. NPDC051098]
MSSPTGPASGLPVRSPRPRQSGRHRRPEPVAAPEGAPALVLAVPGAPGPSTRSLAEEVISIARSELPGLEAGIGYLDGDDSEYPTLETVLAHTAARRTERYEIARAAGREVAEPEGPAAVVVPLLAGPDNVLMRRIRQAVMDSRAAAELTDVLGPHPLLAEAMHVRLSEAGLARA